MKQQRSASKSKHKILHDSAHRPQNKVISLPIHCVFMFRAPLQKSNFARRNAITRIIDNGGAPKHRAECAKIRCRTKKSRNGVWWVHAALPPNVQSVATHSPFRSCGGRKHRYIAGTPKDLAKNNSIAPQGKKPSYGTTAHTTFRRTLCWSPCRSRHQDRVLRHIDYF